MQNHSPATYLNRSGTGKKEAVDSCTPFDDWLTAPFPALRTVPPGKAARPTKNKQRQVVQVVPMSASTIQSAPISLPETHMHRTHSELQLEDDTLYAEYKDDVMYCRLMTGMRSQIQRQCMTSGGNEKVSVHPLSWKSMNGIVKTKQSNDHELEQQQHDDGDGIGNVSYIPIDEEAEICYIDSVMKGVALSKVASKDSLSTLSQENTVSGGLEDVFSLDL